MIGKLSILVVSILLVSMVAQVSSPRGKAEAGTLWFVVGGLVAVGAGISLVKDDCSSLGEGLRLCERALEASDYKWEVSDTTGAKFVFKEESDANAFGHVLADQRRYSAQGAMPVR